MPKGTRKGRVSNEVVAASFAAILTVYGAGFLRTREEARRFGAEAQMRRPVPPSESPGSTAAPPSGLPAESEPPSVVVNLPRIAAPLPRQTPVVSQVPGDPTVPVPSVVPAEPVEQPGAVVAASAPEVAPPPEVIWHDGYYKGWGQSFHGDIEAFVTIKDGRIVEAGIATCATRYPCYVIDTILNQPVVRQSPDVDRVSRATESTDAYYWGLAQALKKAEADPAATAASP